MGTLARAGWGDPESTGFAAPSACLDRTAKNQNVLVSRVGMHRNYGAEREARSVYRPILDWLRQRQSSVTPRKKSIVIHPVASPFTKVCVPGIASPNVMRPTTADPESSKSGNGDLQLLREMTLRSA
jgi:hypothetical protein